MAGVGGRVWNGTGGHGLARTFTGCGRTCAAGRAGMLPLSKIVDLLGLWGFRGFGAFGFVGF